MNSVDLKSYTNPEYNPGANRLKRFIWMLISTFIFQSYLFPFSSIKRIILRMFGAKLGKGVIIKPFVTIKYPWFLKVGNHSWIGEMVWIDNLVDTTIGDNVCLSQGAMLLTGNHDYKSSSFKLITGKIVLENGVWICAKSIVGPGVVCKFHSILSVGSVATKDLDEYTIYSGNPATAVRKREIG